MCTIGNLYDHCQSCGNERKTKAIKKARKTQSMGKKWKQRDNLRQRTAYSHAEKEER